MVGSSRWFCNIIKLNAASIVLAADNVSGLPEKTCVVAPRLDLRKSRTRSGSFGQKVTQTIVAAPPTTAALKKIANALKVPLDLIA
jgi:hypothetical protein